MVPSGMPKQDNSQGMLYNNTHKSDFHVCKFESKVLPDHYRDLNKLLPKKPKLTKLGRGAFCHLSRGLRLEDLMNF